jgi:hypothetical protein
MVTSHDGRGLVLVSDVHLKQPAHLRGSFRHGTAWAHPGRMMHVALVLLISEKGKKQKGKSDLIGISHTQGNPNEGNICSLCFGINGHHRWSGVCQGRRSGRHFDDDDLLQIRIVSALDTFHPSRVFLPALCSSSMAGASIDGRSMTFAVEYPPIQHGTASTAIFFVSFSSFCWSSYGKFGAKIWSKSKQHEHGA